MDPERGAQDVLRCDVCSDEEREKSPAEVHCNTCHTNVCSPCVAKHMTSNTSKKHDIVLLHSANPEIDLPNCSSHSTVKCELFCKKCTIPICLKCLSSDHNSHAVEEIIELCKAIRANIQKDTQKLQAEVIPKFEKLATEEEEKFMKIMQAYDNLESCIEDQGMKIRKAVDDVITKHKAKAQQMKQTDAQILQQQRKDINGLLSETKQEAAQNEMLQRSKNFMDLLAYKPKTRNAPVLKSIIPPVVTPNPVSDDLMETFFGPIPNSQVVVAQGAHSLVENTKLNAIGASTDKILFTFQTPYKQLCRVACTRSGMLWSSGNESMLHCLDMRNGAAVGSNTLKLNPIDICTNDNDDIFVCDGKTVYRGGIDVDFQKFYDVPDGWNVEALSSYRVTITGLSFGILMNLYLFLHREDHRRSKVVLINNNGIQNEFQYDSDGRELYNSNCYDFFLAENRNEDICVSDTSALVVIDKRGKFRFRYHGKVFDTFDKPFKPRGVATDFQGNILLADVDNGCIHLLDQDGGFVRYITCGGSLEKVYDVSCDKVGRVWVAERDTARVKCIEYH